MCQWFSCQAYLSRYNIKASDWCIVTAEKLIIFNFMAFFSSQQLDLCSFIETSLVFLLKDVFVQVEQTLPHSRFPLFTVTPSFSSSFEVWFNPMENCIAIYKITLLSLSALLAF